MADVDHVSTSVPPPNMPGPPEGDLPQAAPPDRPAWRRPRLIAGGVTIAALTALALTVFGSSASNVLDPIAAAAEHSARAPGYRVHVSMTMSSSALPAPITAVGSGVVDARDHAGAMTMRMSLPDTPQVVQRLGGTVLRIQQIVEGTTVYMKLPAALTGQLSVVGKQWVAVNPLKQLNVPGLSSIQSNPLWGNPSETLQYLREISGNVDAVGHARVDGRNTIHYRAALTFSDLANALPGQDQAAARQALAALQQQFQVSTIPVDVWIDREHLVRRVQLTMAASDAAGRSFSMTVTSDHTDYGPQPRPAPPPPDQVATLSGLSG